MYPVRIVVENVGPYVGRHELDLADSVYAVTAQHENNPERSNWLGKSTLLWCLAAYALYGCHPYKTDNDWVNNGQTTALVELELNDGAVVTRTKKRDKSTQLEFALPGQAPVTQKAAQAAIEAHIGLGRDDFMATCFYEQKQLARMVSARSAERIEIVESWLAEDLLPIQNMHSEAGVQLVAVNRQLSETQAKVDELESEWGELRNFYNIADGADACAALGNELEAARAELKAKQAILKRAKAARLEAEAWQAKVEAAEEFDAISAQGQQARDEFDALPQDLPKLQKAAQADVDSLAAKYAEAEQAQRQAEGAKRAEFDGDCPVNGLKCPSAKWVTEQGVAPELVQLRVTDATKARRALTDAREALLRLNGQVTRKAALQAKLDTLREQAGTLLDTANEVAQVANPPDIDALDKAVTEAEEAVTEAKATQNQVTEDSQWVASYSKELKGHESKRAKLTEKRALVLEAVQLLGKTGAQQKLAELALANVEQGANSLLLAAGIELSVSVSWVTHMQGAAKNCDQCGTAFPTSARVKTCQYCAAPRGKNVVAKLVIDLSNRSGAAEDLAGIAVGLAASQWLRHKRASGWSSVFIDEPFGALDTHNKKALSVHVATLLKRSFDSAFVVAHDKSILDALPSRITIIGTDKGSRLQGSTNGEVHLN